MTHSSRYVLPALFGLVGLYFVYLVHTILLPFVLALALAYLLKPLVDFFVVHGLRREPVVIGIYLVLIVTTLGGIYGGSLVLTQEASKAALKMPGYIQKGQAFFAHLQQAGHSPAPSDNALTSQLAKHMDLIAPLLDHAKAWPAEVIQHMAALAGHVLPLVELGVLVPFICFFFMLQGSQMVDGVFQWIPARYVEMSLNVLIEIDNSLGNYLRALSLEALAVGLIAFIGFWGIGLDYSFQIALLMGLGNLIPYVGPIIGALLGSAVAVFQWGSLGGILKVILVCVAVRFIEDWFIQPAIMKRAIHLHPVLIVFSLMAGTTLWGFWGLLFGVPVACMAKVLVQVLASWWRSEYGLQPETAAEVSHIPLI